MQNLTIRSTIIALLILFLTACGGSSSDDSGSTIPVVPPVAPPPTVNISAVVPTAPTVGESVSFTATGSGQSISYAWNFGDGKTGAGANPSHAYTSAGDFDVSVTVTDQKGLTAKATAHLVVANAAISASISSISPLSPSAGQTVTFTGVGKGQGSLTYAWTFGDGTTANTPTAKHSYSNAGNYTVTLVVTDSVGQTAKASNGVSVVSTPVTPPPITVTSISSSPASPIVGQMVTVAATGSGGKSPLTYKWNFGDGTANQVGSLSGVSVVGTHTYTTAGSYIVTLTATDQAGQSASTSKSISIATIPVPPPLTTQIDSITPTSPNIGQLVDFAGNSTSRGPLTYTWNYGDGTGGVGLSTGSGNGTTGQHTYSQVGTYTVTLTAINSTGERATATKTVTVVNAPILPTARILDILVPNPNGFPTRPLPLTPLTLMQFIGIGTGTGALTYNWDFGDGSTGTGDQATHTYSSIGTYTVKLTVTDSTGATSALATKTIKVVTPQGPAALTLVPETTGFTVTTTNNLFFVTTVTGTGPLTYIWDFGDGSPTVTTTSPTSPTHTYTTAGIYTVSMTVNDSFGQHATAAAVILSPYVVAILAVGVPMEALTFDSGSSTLYFINQHKIQKISATGIITTIAGGDDLGYVDGAASNALFENPGALAFDSTTGTLYVADTGNCAIRVISSAGVVSTLAGNTGCGFADGTGTAAGFQYPSGLAYDNVNHLLYVSDTNNNVIRTITSTGVVTTIAGVGKQSGSADGVGSAARFFQPRDLVYDANSGTLYVSDATNRTIRKIASNGVVTTLAGGVLQSSYVDGVGTAARFLLPYGLALDSSSGMLYVADNGLIRRLDPVTGSVITKVGSLTREGVFGPASPLNSGNTGARSVVVTGPGTIVFNGGALYRVNGL